MSIVLKDFDAFDSWDACRQWLRESTEHYVVANERPPISMSALYRHIFLRGIADPAPFFPIPEDWPVSKIETLAEYFNYRSFAVPPSASTTVSSFQIVDFLREFSDLLKGKYQMEEVAQAITDKTCKLFGAEGASILVPIRGKDKFRFAYVKTPSKAVAERLAKAEAPADRGITGYVATHKRSILVTDVANSPHFNPGIDENIDYQTHNIMATPIMIGKDLIGILEVVNKREGTFRESDVHIADLIATVIAIFIEKAELFSEQVGLVRIQKELEIARNLQTHMMPQLPMQIGPFHLNGQSLQVSGVGGDFWDVLYLNDNEYLLVLGDVSGHGLSAALLMSAIRTASRVLASQISSPTDLLPPLNALINREFGSKNIFLTLIMGHLKLDTREIHLARAGHEYPLIRDENGLHQFKREGGFPLGLLSLDYKIKWETIPLKPGHRLYLYTDGVLDGFPGEPEDLSELLADMHDMDDHMEAGDLFQVLRQRKQWESLDDATFLQLILQEAT